MLTGKVLNSNASLNDFRYLQNLEFMVGSKIKFAFRLFDHQLDERHVPPMTAVTTVFFNQTDGTLLEKTATVINEGDRSMLYVDITEDESENLMGGNVTFEVDVLGDGSEIDKGWIQLALSKVTTSCGTCC